MDGIDDVSVALSIPSNGSITRFRNSAKAIIIVDSKVLAVQIRDDEAGEFYVLPGGGQHAGETLTDALQRECIEEIGTPVIIHELCFVRDYIGRNHDFAQKDQDLHIVELMFRCDLEQPDTLGNGTLPDVGQIGIAWLPLDKLTEHRFYPEALHPYLQDGLAAGEPLYLGDVA